MKRTCNHCLGNCACPGWRYEGGCGSKTCTCPTLPQEPTTGDSPGPACANPDTCQGCAAEAVRQALGPFPRAEAAPGLRPAHIVAAEAVTAGWLTRAGYYTKRAALESAFTKAIEADRASRPAPVTVPGARETARAVLAVGQTWTFEDGSEAKIVSIDDDTSYPVLFEWHGGAKGRDTIGGFLRDFNRPAHEWVAAIESHTRGLAAEVERLKRENVALKTSREHWIKELEKEAAEVSRLSREREELRASEVAADAEVERLRGELRAIGWEAPGITHCGSCYSVIDICEKRSKRRGYDCDGLKARRALT